MVGTRKVRGLGVVGVDIKTEVRTLGHHAVGASVANLGTPSYPCVLWKTIYNKSEHHQEGARFSKEAGFKKTTQGLDLDYAYSTPLSYMLPENHSHFTRCVERHSLSGISANQSFIAKSVPSSLVRW